MVYLPPNCLSNILGFYAGFHEAKANVIARAWRIAFRRRLGRVGRIQWFETPHRQRGYSFTPRGVRAYKEAFNRRVQRVGDAASVIRGRHVGRIGAILRTTPQTLVLEDAKGDRFRVNRSSVGGALWSLTSYCKRNEGGAEDRCQPTMGWLCWWLGHQPADRVHKWRYTPSE